METCLDKLAWDNFLIKKDSSRYLITLEDDGHQFILCITSTPKGFRLEGLGRAKDDSMYKEEAVLLSHFLGDSITGKRFSRGKYAYRINHQYKTATAVRKALDESILKVNELFGTEFLMYEDQCMERDLHYWNWNSIEKNRFGKFFMYNDSESACFLSVAYYMHTKKWFIYGIQDGEYTHTFFDTFEEMYQALADFRCLDYLKSA